MYTTNDLNAFSTERFRMLGPHVLGGKGSLGQVHLANASRSFPLLEIYNLHPRVQGSESSLGSRHAYLCLVQCLAEPRIFLF